jgi:ATP-dependent DNA helicase RecQ
LVFQLSGLEMDGTTMIISPLRALMHEQVNELKNKGISSLSFTGDIGFQNQRKYIKKFEYIKL